jgi:DNA-binding NarL/FixJ family response regulator
VVIADRTKIGRTSCLRRLRREQGISVVGQAETKGQVVKALRLKPQILILDWAIFALSGKPLLMLVRRHSPTTKVILLASRVRPMRLLRALLGGARGYLQRSRIGDSLVKAVRLVNGGEAWVSRAMVPWMMAFFAVLRSGN